MLPPLQGGGDHDPIMIVQDTISVYVYRRDWSAWNLKVMLAGSVFGVALAGVGAAYLSDAQVRLAVGAIGSCSCSNNWLARVPTARDSRARECSGARWPPSRFDLRGRTAYYVQSAQRARQDDASSHSLIFSAEVTG